jgi:hypothetical protein
MKWELEQSEPPTHPPEPRCGAGLCEPRMNLLGLVILLGVLCGQILGLTAVGLTGVWFARHRRSTLLFEHPLTYPLLLYLPLTCLTSCFTTRLTTRQQ